MTIAVIAVGDATEALVIRAILENLGALVILHLPGTPDAFLCALDDRKGDPRFVVISGHGTENGLHFGEYAPELKIDSLVDGCLPPEAIANSADLTGRTVISTACCSGSRAFRDAFATCGVDGYIAPAGYPSGTEALLFIHRLFFHLIERGLPLGEAINGANEDGGQTLGFSA